jgi:hypothetical protein
MLDRASIERLSRSPEKNAPMLNVALAEEGTAAVLLALARSAAVGPEALAVIADRIARDGADVGRDPDAQGEDVFVSPAEDLDRLLVAHIHAPDAVRDAVLGRHPNDPFFVLAAACHSRATPLAIEKAVDWPSASPVHDRLWVALLAGLSVSPITLEEGAQDESPLRREAAARIAREPAIWERLAGDPSRQVRRAIASNRFAIDARARLCAGDPAPEVRARAAGATSHGAEVTEAEPRESVVQSARFAAALRAMKSGGVLAPDVIRALSSAADLDDEGAMIAGQVLPRGELGSLMEAIVDLGVKSPCGVSLAAGLALRPPAAHADEADAVEGEIPEIVRDAVKALSRVASPEDRLTGKARLAAWAADGLVDCRVVDRGKLFADLARGPLGAERMILARGAGARPALIPELTRAARDAAVVPAAVVELAWADHSIADDIVVGMASRIPKPRKREEDLPEDEIDFDPSVRSLAVLERVVLAATLRANVSPRSALAVVALESRRVRYVLSALPQWKQRLTGGRLARVLRQHAGALSAARTEARAREAKVEDWTQRRMSEIELSVALAVGHLTGEEVARRIIIGRQIIDDGLDLVSGAEARAAIEGQASIVPILEWASKRRASDPAALAMWLLLEKYDRSRAPTLVASSLDGLAAAGKGVVAPSVCDALALIERRSPGRLEAIHPQSPRGRATLASAIARAYRAVGGTRDELKQ